MDAAESAGAEALTELVALSTEIERAALVDAQGAVLAATSATDGERLAKAAAELFGAAPASTAAVAQVEVDLARGSVFAVRSAGCVAVVTTAPEPASALVLHDLRTLLRRVTTDA